VVLGPSQRRLDIDRDAAARHGLEIAYRESGGGAVLLRGEGHEVWVDVRIDRDDPRWDDDVGRAMWWVGDAWVEALGRGEVWRRPMERRAGGDLACWGTVGPGEVVDEDGRKLVGISQRRTRAGALFQACAYLVWDQAALEDVVRLPAGTLRDAGAPVDDVGLARRVVAALEQRA
jgi:lipoate-protein ligase A